MSTESVRTRWPFLSREWKEKKINGSSGAAYDYRASTAHVVECKCPDVRKRFR